MTGTLLAEGTRTRGAAEMLAAELKSGPGSATRLLEKVSGHTLRLDTAAPEPARRPLKDDEAYRLGAPAGQECYSRGGWLRYGVDRIAATVTFTWLPARLPAAACVQLAHTNRPAGLILQDYGTARADRRALVLTGYEDELDPGDDGLDIAIRSSAVLVVGGWRAAIATERVTWEFLIDLG